MPTQTNYNRMSSTKPLSRSAAVVSKTMYEAMKILRDNNSQMSFAQIRERIRQSMVFTEWESSPPSANTRMPRWEINMSWYAMDYEAAGFIVREGGIWYLTNEGVKQLAQSPEQVFAAAHTAYRISMRENGKYETIDEDVKEVKDSSPIVQLTEAEAMAAEAIRQYIQSMDWQEFQRMIAALLRAMGYYVPFIAPQGADGGIDVLAYENASGVGHRIVVQAKRFKGSPVGVEVVRNMAALLYKPSDAGMVVTSSHFTSEAIRFAQSCKFNLRLIDLGELTRLWISYYDRLSLPEREILPVRAVYFLAK